MPVFGAIVIMYADGRMRIKLRTTIIAAACEKDNPYASVGAMPMPILRVCHQLSDIALTTLRFVIYGSSEIAS